ncbi:hypothetical protein SRABI106_04079 [Rahnella aquatilis]|nr:hypothetical protein SRABI106_04079 [Rahnella aquatilis]
MDLNFIPRDIQGAWQRKAPCSQVAAKCRQGNLALMIDRIQGKVLDFHTAISEISNFQRQGSIEGLQIIQPVWLFIHITGDNGC